MLSKHFLSNVGAETLQVTETPTFLRVAWPIRSEHAASVQSALEATSFVAPRDTYELLLDAGEEQLSVSRNSPPEQQKLLTFLDAAREASDVFATLRITKAIEDGRCSVYFLDKLGSYFRDTDVQDVMNTLASSFTDRLQFEVFESLRPFGTGTICFSGKKELVVAKVDSRRQEKLETFTSNCNVAGVPPRMLPSDFFLIERSDIDVFNEFFDTAAAVLSLAYLANTSEFRAPGLLSYKVFGYRAVVCSDVEASSLRSAVRTLHEIFAWTYEGGSAADKLGLVRNVVSIHLDDLGRPKFDEYVRDAIHSNYQIYLKGNIQSYLEVKNKLADLLLESVERTGKLADEVFDSFKNNAFVVITFLLTVVVINGLKDSSFASIFSSPYVFLAGFLALCSVLWMVLVRKDAFERYASSTETVEGVLRTNYEKFLMRSEIDASLQPTLTRNQLALKSRVAKYSRWWVVLLFLFTLFFFSGNYFFSTSEDLAAQPSTQSLSSSNAALAAAAASKALPTSILPAPAASKRITRDPPTASRPKSRDPAHVAAGDKAADRVIKKGE